MIDQEYAKQFSEHRQRAEAKQVIHKEGLTVDLAKSLLHLIREVAVIAKLLGLL